MTSAEGYLNRYRNGWSASAAAVKAYVDETVRRRGKSIGGKPPVPLSELPVSIPISRFLWPFVRAPFYWPVPCSCPIARKTMVMAGCAHSHDPASRVCRN
jgi:hypothetical protein